MHGRRVSQQHRRLGNKTNRRAIFGERFQSLQGERRSYGASRFLRLHALGRKERGNAKQHHQLAKAEQENVGLFFARKTFYTISDYYGLSDILSKCDSEDREVLDKKLKLKQLLKAEQVEFAFA